VSRSVRKWSPGGIPGPTKRLRKVAQSVRLRYSLTLR
jgi:hypothetical protein